MTTQAALFDWYDDKRDKQGASSSAPAKPVFWLSGGDAEEWARQCQREALASAERLLRKFDNGTIVVSKEYHERIRRNVEVMKKRVT